MCSLIKAFLAVRSLLHCQNLPVISAGVTDDCNYNSTRIPLTDKEQHTEHSNESYKKKVFFLWKQIFLCKVWIYISKQFNCKHFVNSLMHFTFHFKNNVFKWECHKNFSLLDVYIYCTVYSSRLGGDGFCAHTYLLCMY